MLREILYHDTVVPLLERGLDAFAARQRAIASNLANSEVPGYTPLDISFEDRLKRILNDRKPFVREGDATGAETEFIRGRIIKAGEDTEDHETDIDRRMAELATNQIQYHTATLAVKTQFSLVRSAIGKAVGGGK